jgi:hypothetical protein
MEEEKQTNKKNKNREKKTEQKKDRWKEPKGIIVKHKKSGKIN